MIIQRATTANLGGPSLDEAAMEAGVADHVSTLAESLPRGETPALDGTMSDDDLRQMVRHLSKFVLAQADLLYEATNEIAAMRELLLVPPGAFTREDFDKTLAYLRSETAKKRAGSLEAEKTARLAAFLRTFDGPEQ